MGSRPVYTTPLRFVINPRSVDTPHRTPRILFREGLRRLSSLSLFTHFSDTVLFRTWCQRWCGPSNRTASYSLERQTLQNPKRRLFLRKYADRTPTKAISRRETVALDLIPPGRVFVELGCGNGVLLHAAAARFD